MADIGTVGLKPGIDNPDQPEEDTQKRKGLLRRDFFRGAGRIHSGIHGGFPPAAAGAAVGLIKTSARLVSRDPDQQAAGRSEHAVSNGREAAGYLPYHRSQPAMNRVWNVFGIKNPCIFLSSTVLPASAFPAGFFKLRHGCVRRARSFFSKIRACRAEASARGGLSRRHWPGLPLRACAYGQHLHQMRDGPHCFLFDARVGKSSRSCPPRSGRFSRCRRAAPCTNGG